MEVLAKHRFARTSAQKARLVADQIRGLPVAKAHRNFDFQPKESRRTG